LFLPEAPASECGKMLQSYFPEYNVINNGFGGSHFSDLLYFYHEMIVKPAPEILFIYEGDNDIASTIKNLPKIIKGSENNFRKNSTGFA
jgi:hypothetical protein